MRPTPRPTKRFNAHDKMHLVDYCQKHPEEQDSILKDFNMTKEEYTLLERRIQAYGLKGGQVTRINSCRKKDKENAVHKTTY